MSGPERISLEPALNVLVVALLRTVSGLLEEFLEKLLAVRGWIFFTSRVLRMTAWLS
jgi:hypothetical protein